MTLNELRSFFVTSLISIYDREELLNFFYLVTEKWMNKNRIQFALHHTEGVDEKTLVIFKNIIHRLAKEEPIQYILGETFFYDSVFTVDHNVLIPRPETEELVAWILEDYKNELGFPFSVLDIGTGSGCIAITLSKNLKATVNALDVSDPALQRAKKNAEIHRQNITWIQGDVLTMQQLPSNYHIIVSNPPYVTNAEKGLMKNNVLNFEPEKALFVPDTQPLIFYQKIAELGQQHLFGKGSVYFEINENFGNNTAQLLKEFGYIDIQLKKDFRGKERFIKGIKK